MPVYRHFAKVYDLFMAETPYAAWVDYIDENLRTFLKLQDSEIKRTLVLDMACGTGNITVPLAVKGYDMIGTDASRHMLSEAQDKALRNDADILFLAQNLCRLDLYGTVDAALCVCDGLNYIPHVRELYRIFRRTARFMNPGGIFIFDMNTAYKFQHLLADNTFTDIVPNASYLWRNYYDAQSGVNEYKIHFFIQRPDGQTRYFAETHFQYAYDPADISRLLQRAGFALRRVNNAYTYDPPTPESERLSFIAQKL